MFSCFAPSRRSSRFQSPLTERFSGFCRRWFNPRPRRLWPFPRRSPKSSTQENGKEPMDGDLNSIPLQEVQGYHTSTRVQSGPQGEKPPTPHGKKSCMLQTSQVHWLNRLLEYLVTAFRGKDRSFVSTFLHRYRTFAATQQVLDQLFLRYGCIFPYCEEDRGPQDRQRQAISSILDIWLDQHPEDFFQPPEFLCLMMLLAYLELNFPGSELEHRAQLLLSELQHLEPSEAGTQEPAAEREQEIPEEEMPSAGPSPGPEPAPGTASTQPQEAEPLKAPEPLVSAAGRPPDPGAQPLALLTAPATE